MRAALSYEWVRITTVRSTYWMVGLTWFFFCGLSAILAMALGSASFSDLEVTDVWSYITTAVVTGGGSVAAIPVLSAPFCGVLGAMAFGHEYRHGTIKQTLCAVPNRVHVFAAKAIVVAGWVLVLSTLILLLNIGSAALFLDRFSFTADAWRPMTAFVLYNLAFAWSGLGLAMVVRNLAGALVAVLVWPYAIEPVLFAILRFATGLGNLNKLGNFLPASAARRTIFSPFDFWANGLGSEAVGGFHTWGLAGSLAVEWGGVLLLLAVGLTLFLRRDA